MAVRGGITGKDEKKNISPCAIKRKAHKEEKKRSVKMNAIIKRTQKTLFSFQSSATKKDNGASVR